MAALFAKAKFKSIESQNSYYFVVVVGWRCLDGRTTSTWLKPSMAGGSRISSALFVKLQF